MGKSFDKELKLHVVKLVVEGENTHSHQVKNLIFFQRQKHGILSNENHRWKGLFFDGKKDEGMDKNDSSTLLL
ncbi:hypothetical protein [Parageobacillus toebii]|uniref:hypothetical protein n=1 Tax=Parageobacillus toebii TaxID=153151 RepID=UPI002E1E169C|nr:hypothetical protein [Parageobacillus toebii]